MLCKPTRFSVAFILLTFSLSAVPVGPTHAALVPTESLIATQSVSAERQTVVDFMAREDVQSELMKYGVNQDEASARVAALTDAEISRIAERIEELPVGQDAGAALISAAVTIFIILLITDLLCLTSVFNFTRCAR